MSDSDWLETLWANCIPCDENDMKIYMLGYLKGCEDMLKKCNELNNSQYSIPYTVNYLHKDDITKSNTQVAEAISKTLKEFGVVSTFEDDKSSVVRPSIEIRGEE